MYGITLNNPFLYSSWALAIDFFKFHFSAPRTGADADTTVSAVQDNAHSLKVLTMELATLEYHTSLSLVLHLV